MQISHTQTMKTNMQNTETGHTQTIHAWTHDNERFRLRLKQGTTQPDVLYLEKQHKGWGRSLMTVMLTLLLCLSPLVLFSETVQAAGAVQPVDTDIDRCFAIADGYFLNGSEQKDSNANDTLAFLNRITANTNSVNGGVPNMTTVDVESMAIQPGGDTLYAADAGQLGVVDLNTAVFTATVNTFGTGEGYKGVSPVLTTDSFDDVDSLSFDPTTGYLWGVNRNAGSGAANQPDTLFRIDPATGSFVPDAFPDPYNAGQFVDFVEVTPITDTDLEEFPLADIDDIAIDPIHGTLYAIMNLGGGPSKLVIINTATGDTTEVGNFTRQDTGEQIEDMEGLSFFNDGNLYGSTGKNWRDGRNVLWSIDKDTAVVQYIAEFTNDLADIEALDCLSAPAFITVEKSTNGVDADDAPGLLIEVGEDIVWTYFVRNTGGQIITDISVTDDNGTPNDTGDDVVVCSGFTLAPGESNEDVQVSCTLSDTAQADQYTNIAVVSGTYNEETLTDDDPSNYFGYIPALLGDYVWVDVDKDGVQDNFEPAVENVAVTLHLSDGSVVSTTTTSDTGFYFFNNLPPASYYLQFDLSPTNFVSFTTRFAGSDTELDSNADPDGNSPTFGQTEVFTLTSGAMDRSYDAGLLGDGILASLGDFVWEDLNRNGIQDNNEPGLAGVEIGLYDINNTQVGVTVTTSASGAYSFTNLIPDDYMVLFSLPNGYLRTLVNAGSNDDIDSDAAGTGETGLINLSAGENDITIDAGYYQLASLGDFVWHDLDADGIQEDNEPGIANIVVTLTDSDGVTATTTTNDSGFYSFTSIVPGTVYSLTFTVPAGYLISPQDQGSDNTVDSDANPSTGVIPNIVLTSGATDWTYDVGLYQNGSIGDYVWHDDDRDGVQDVGESGIPSVTVRLLDDNNTVLGTTETDGNGGYLFPGLTPAVYTVVVDESTVATTLPNYVQTFEFDGTLDGSLVVTLTSGEDFLDADFGYDNSETTIEFEKYINGAMADSLADAVQVEVSQTITFAYAVTNTGEITLLWTSLTDTVFGDLTNECGLTIEIAPNAAAVCVITRTAGDHPEGRQNIGQATLMTLNENPLDPVADEAWYQTPDTPDLASIGDYVWLDDDGNGLQDNGENGIAGIRVELINVLGQTLAETVTDNDGFYRFTDLEAGPENIYRVRFILPNPNFTFTEMNAGDDDTLDSDASPGDDIDSDANPGSGNTTLIILEPGEYNDTIDAGLVTVLKPATLGDFVWEDLDGDGVQDDNEPGIAGVTVWLLDSNGARLTSDTTDSDGKYLFDNLAPDTYAVEFIRPDGFYPTDADQGGDDAKDSDANVNDGTTPNVTLGSGEVNTTLDAGFIRGATIGDLVWLDTDGDGIQDDSDGVPVSGINGVQVLLLDTNGNQLASTTTDEDGEYEFTGLDAGSYVVQFVQPGDLYPTEQDAGDDDTKDSDASPDDGKTAPVTVALDEDNDTIDAGFAPGATIGDFVWQDLDGDGVQDGSEPGVENVLVNLLDENGSVVMTDTTDVDGMYAFTNVVPNTYTVEFVSPTGFLPTLPNQGGDDSEDSDANIDTGQTEPFAVEAGETNDTIDAGFSPIVSLDAIIGDYVWEDLDDDGIQDDDEEGIEGVTVFLVDVTEPMTPTTVMTETTDSDGFYLFLGLSPGVYQVEFARPEGFFPSDADQDDPEQDNDDAVDSDPTSSDELADGTTVDRTEPITLTEGELNDTIDAGYVPGVTIGDLVWEDLNGNGVQDGPEGSPNEENGEPGLPGIVVELLDSEGTVVYTTTTDANGIYTFTNVPAGDYAVHFEQPDGYDFTSQDQFLAQQEEGDDDRDSDPDPTDGTTILMTFAPGEVNDSIDAGLFQPATLGDRVWDDQNGNGLQDDGEPGVGSVEVTLHQQGVVAALESTFTDASGLYTFTDIAPGSYYVIFNPLPGTLLTMQDAGEDEDPANDIIDSDANPTTGVTAPITLTSGMTNDTLDAGVFEPSSLGDRAWVDQNGNGIQDDGEEGLDGVLVTLFRQDGALIAQTSTDNGGQYLFEDLAPGSYYIIFAQPNGFVFSPQSQGDNAALDSDPSQFGATPTFTLPAGTTNTDIDAGLVPLGVVGDYVWSDGNGDGIQNVTEPGIGDIQVTIYNNDDDSQVAQTTTDDDGLYEFTQLEPGTYYIIVQRPDGFEFTQQDAGDNDAIDSDVDSNGQTDPFVIDYGTENNTVDGGLQPLIPAIEVEKSTNGEDADVAPGPEVPVGSIVIWRYVVRNIGNADLINVVLEDDKIGTINGTASCPQTTLAVGESMTCTVNGAAIVGQYQNTATVTANVDSQPEISVSDEDLSHYIGVTTDLSISKTDDADPAEAGETLIYTLIYSNAGPSTAFNVQIVDDLPLNVVFNQVEFENPEIEAEPIVTLVPGDNHQRIIWTLPELASGEQGLISYSVDTDPNLDGDTILNTVRIDSDTFDANPTNNEDDEFTTFTAQGVITGTGQLPSAIELLNFMSSVQQNEIEIRWVTGAELDTWGFYLYRSTENVFEEAVRVTADVITAKGEDGGEYTYVDTSALSGVEYYYWLVEIENGIEQPPYGPVQGMVERASLDQALQAPHLSGELGFQIFLPVVNK